MCRSARPVRRTMFRQFRFRRLRFHPFRFSCCRFRPSSRRRFPRLQPSAACSPARWRQCPPPSSSRRMPRTSRLPRRRIPFRPPS
nr:MAG TPA: hypothetical protein [Caudoviricetes sp.]